MGVQSGNIVHQNMIKRYAEEDDVYSQVILFQKPYTIVWVRSS
jgi:hypothetical protein